MLTPLSSVDDRPLIVQAGARPTVRGFEPDGTDCSCPNCGKSLILERVVLGEVFDLAFRCGVCARLSASPRVPSGFGLGSVAIVIPNGIHHVDRPLENAYHRVIVGQPGMERRANETGNALGKPANSAVRRVVADSAGLESILQRARTLFAKILPRLEVRDRRSRRHRATPSGVRHRLPDLIHRLEETITGIRNGSDEIDILSFIELHRACDLFERWKCDPALETMIVQSQDPAHFQHDLVVLAAASAMTDSGLGAQIVVDERRRTADLRINVALRRFFDAEVKAPRELQRRPGIALTTSERELVSHCLREADGQLRSDGPGVLVIGGAFWSGDFEALVSEARSLWAAVGERRKHIAAIWFVSTGVQYQRRPDTVDEPFGWHQVDWLPHVACRWVANPHYDRSLKVTFPETFFGEYAVSYPSG